ncbi:DsbA family protein [Flexivirga meconopsidis]|uniref:DsbA family protein n=1 Tax=Flexivirga meconopsidis TaxID=2977121 RepID=UPI00223FC67B
MPSSDRRPRFWSRRAALAVGLVPLLAACGSGSGGGAGGTAGTDGSSGGAASPAPSRSVAPPAGISYGPWLRPTSHFLDAGSSKAVLVEFLDFECEACGAVFPVMEQLREQYKGKLTYAIRYFPLDGHFNSKRAAYAVEAAARQGRLEPMYRLMYTNQKDWAEQQVPTDDTFRGYARQLGLDMTKWEADYTSDSVKQRVEADLKDATALNLKGTPSFFFNGKPFEPKSVQDLQKTVGDAVA